MAALTRTLRLIFAKRWFWRRYFSAKKSEGLVIRFRPDSQRYFDYHHTNQDNIEAVNQRELELGAASMATLVLFAG